MKRKIFNRSPFGYAALGCCAIIAVAASVPAIADSWDKKTVLTVNQPIQVRDTVLEPGKYVFKLLNSSSDRHIVQIFNADQSHIIATELAIPNYRLQPTGDSRFSFWETPPGNAKALRAWFYPGDNYGQEFPYPKHLTQIASNEPAAFTPRLESAPAPSPAVAPEPAPAPPPPPEAAAPAEPVPSPPPAPEPAPQAPADTAAPATPPAPAELPHTASPFPLIGLAGLMSLGVFAILRFKRVAN
jgi:outer membrane biosynthesis protein TonB